MKFSDKIDFIGHFSIKAIAEDGTILDEYSEKNLVVDGARAAMAASIGGQAGSIINGFKIGTKGHNSDVLDYVQVGEAGPDATLFDANRTGLFSESIVTTDSTFYTINFDVNSASNPYTDNSAIGFLTTHDGVSATQEANDVSPNTVQRTVSGNTVTYTITIPADNANESGSVLAYTEAALYAGSTMFSMKTFPARVKEETVRFEITWSIIF